MSLTEQKLNALGAFKDWSNYLLVTTVVALGWVAGADTDKPLTLATKFEVFFLAASVIFGIFTLAVIPIIAEQITDGTESIYGVEAPFNLFWMWGPEKRIRLKAVCWPQHVCFIIAIAFHAAVALGLPHPQKDWKKRTWNYVLKSKLWARKIKHINNQIRLALLTSAIKTRTKTHLNQQLTISLNPCAPQISMWARQHS